MNPIGQSYGWSTIYVGVPWGSILTPLLLSVKFDSCLHYSFRAPTSRYFIGHTLAVLVKYTALLILIMCSYVASRFDQAIEKNNS